MSCQIKRFNPRGHCNWIPVWPRQKNVCGTLLHLTWRTNGWQSSVTLRMSWQCSHVVLQN